MRIATVKATGDRYLIQKLDIPRTGEGRVHCWGEVVGFKTSARSSRTECLSAPASTRHAASRTFVRSAVDVSEDVVVTGSLAAELIQQMQRNSAQPTTVSSSFRRAR